MLHLLLSVSRLCSRPGSGTVCALLLRGAIPAGLLPGETLLLLRLEPLLAELLLLGLGAVATTHGLLSVSLLTHRALRGAIPTARLLAVGSVLLLPIALLRPRGRVSARLTARVRLTVTALLTLLTLLNLAVGSLDVLQATPRPAVESGALRPEGSRQVSSAL